MPWSGLLTTSILTLTVLLCPLAKGQSGVLREVWTNVSGTSISALDAFEAFPHRPVLAEVIPTLQTETDWTNYYGQRLRALITPTVTGSYTFALSGDDNAELLLSATDSRQDARRIARVPGWTSPLEWDKFDEQRSEPQSLLAGQSYYIEVLHKEHSGGDNLAVAWSLNGGDLEIIPNTVLQPVGNPLTFPASGLAVEAGADQEIFQPRLSATLAGQVLDRTGQSGSPTAIWTVTGGSGAVIAAPDQMTTEVTFPGPGTYTFTLTVIKKALLETDTVKVTVRSPLDPSAGKAIQAFWLDVRGEAIEELTSHLDFPAYPHMTREVDALEGPSGFASYYGTRTTGYLLAPHSGDYRFYVSGDDTVQFSLSHNASPENAVVIATVPHPSGAGDFLSSPDHQISAPVTLTEGERYYFELLHKENYSSDHHGVYWAREGDHSVRLITGEFLAPTTSLDSEVPVADPESDYLISAGRDQILYLPDTATAMNGYASKRRWNAELVSQTWRVVGNASGIAIADPTDPETLVSFPGKGLYTLEWEVVTADQTLSDRVRIDIRDALAENTGMLTREVWFHKSLDSLDALRALPEYPDAPHIVDSLPSLKGPTDWSSRYGTRVTGYLQVPADGDYTFYITGDDEAELRISSNDLSNNLRYACSVPSYTRSEAWFDHPEQQSDPFTLKAGQRYFVELLHRETWGSDHFQVAWTVNDDRRPVPIEGSYFAPIKPAPAYREEVSHYAYAGADRAYHWPHQETHLSGSIQQIRESEATFSTEWTQISGPTADLQNASDLNAWVGFPGMGRYTFRFTVTSSDGIQHQDDIDIVLLPPLTEDTGTLLRSVWLDVDGYTIDDLEAADPGLYYPDFEDLLPGTQTPNNWAHYYGQRLAGYLHVPIAGDYTFWVAANETAQLWLSPSTNPAEAEQIGFVNASVNPLQWTRREGQESAPIRLEAGRYYLEALHKEYHSSDHFALAWSGPATNGRELISRGFLSPLRDAPDHNPNIQVVLGPDRVLLWPDDTLRLTGLVYDLEDGPAALEYTWSHEARTPTASFTDPHYPGTDVRFPGPGIYIISLEASDGVHQGKDSIIVTVQDPLDASAGGLLREVYTDISGSHVPNLTEASVFPDHPTFTDTLTSFDTPVDWADNYGTRVRGYLRVPETDDYTFFIASDDRAELWLNANGPEPTSKERIAHTEWATGRYRWNRTDSQASASIRLRAGVRYYIEALQKEGSGGDYLSVGWRRTDSEEDIRVIQGPMLVPFASADAHDEAIAMEAGPNQSARWPIEYVTLQGHAYDLTPGPLTLTTSWTLTKGNEGVEIESPNALETKVRFPGPGKYTLQLTATDGDHTRQDRLVVRILEPLAPDTGSVLCEVFENLPGYWVTDLTKADTYPHAPSARTQLKSLEMPANTADQYGARIRGYLHPDRSGVHRFNIAGDDWAEFYLSTDATEANKELVCFTPAAVSYYEWLRFPDYQVSRPIVLKKGEKYYLEARLKDHGSRDHLAIAWHAPRTDHYEIVPGANLSPILPVGDTMAPSITLQGASEITLTVDSEFVDPGIIANDETDGDLTGQVLVDHNIDVSTPGEYAVRYRVLDAAGNESEEHVRRVTVVLADTPPAVYAPDRSGTHSTDPWPEPSPDAITSMDASRFLQQATFGATEGSIAEVQRLGYSNWLDAQLAMPASLHLPEMDRYARFRGAQGDTTYGVNLEQRPGELPFAEMRTHDRHYVWWTQAIKAPDQLRQRIAFALSEILVISDRGSDLSRYPRGTTHYYDLLVKHAFGNYRQLLEDISLNPMMGIWLTHVRSSKESPDENYPRELMQLFSIGLAQLNQDGTLKLGSNGKAQPTYDQDIILDLSRALTGWTFAGSQSFYSTPSTGVDSIAPLIAFEEEHDRGAKTLLGGEVLPAGQTAEQDLQSVIDNVFAHPNVGPFICRRLIQRLVTSNPSPAYLFRVAGVFNDNGHGVRGDLGAVVKAILLDPEARVRDDSAGAGKLKEPIMRLASLFRACYSEPSSNPPTLGRFVLNDTTSQYGQAPLSAATVFNFFEPDFSPAGPLVDAGLYGPEFQIVTETTAVDMANHLYDGIRYGFAVDRSQVDYLRLNLAAIIARVSNSNALIDYLEVLLIGRPLASASRAELSKIVSQYQDDPEAAAESILQTIVAIPEFAVQR